MKSNRKKRMTHIVLHQGDPNCEVPPTESQFYSILCILAISQNGRNNVLCSAYDMFSKYKYRSVNLFIFSTSVFGVGISF